MNWRIPFVSQRIWQHDLRSRCHALRYRTRSSIYSFNSLRRLVGLSRTNIKLSCDNKYSLYIYCSYVIVRFTQRSTFLCWRTVKQSTNQSITKWSYSGCGSSEVIVNGRPKLLSLCRRLCKNHIIIIERRVDSLIVVAVDVVIIVIVNILQVVLL